MTSRRALQVLLSVIGLVALTFGTLSMILGPGAVADGGSTSVNVDSELRFYGAWYAAAGLVLLHSARRPESEGPAIRVVCVTFGLAGLARLLGIVLVGAPDPVFVALMVAEWVIPIVVIPWQASVAGSASDKEGSTVNGA